MMLLNHTGFRKHQLRGDQGLSPAWTENSQIRFDLRTLPLLTGGNLANYLMGIVITFVGAINVTATAGSFITANELIQVLINNVQLTGAWQGKPIASEAFRGPLLRIIEFVSLGYQNWSNRRLAFDGNVAGTGSHGFRLSVFLPLGFYAGQKPHHAAQLAVFYRDATLDLNTGLNATMNTVFGMNAANVIAGTPIVRATAILLPDRELRIGPFCEWAEYVQPSVSGGPLTEQVSLDSFGNKTGLSGVEPGAGIGFCGIVCDPPAADGATQGLLGSVDASTITQLEVPWRGQAQTQHIDPFTDEGVTARGVMRLVSPTTLDTAAGLPAATHDYRGFPFSDRAKGVTQAGVDPQTMVLPLVSPSIQMQFSKLQVVEGTQDYSVTGTFNNTTGRQHRTLVMQIKSLTPEKWADAREILIREGLCRAVLGSDDVVWSTKFSEKNPNGVEASKVRFLPQRLRKRVVATAPAG